MMNDCGLWEIATGGLARIEDYSALRGLEPVAAEVADPELGLVVLGGFVREDLERICDRFRLSNAERTRMRTAWAALKRLRQAKDFPDAPALVYEFGRQGAIDGLLAFWARLRGQGRVDDGPQETLLSRLREVPLPEFPLKGADLIATGHKPGPALGDLLKQLEAKWRESGFTLDKVDLIRLADA
jgi:poly(A) polymerase